MARTRDRFKLEWVRLTRGNSVEWFAIVGSEVSFQAARRKLRRRHFPVQNAHRLADHACVLVDEREFLPAFEITSWGGVCGPASIPAPIAARIAELGREALEAADVRRRYEENGATVWWTPPQGLADFRRENEARFAPLIRAAGAVVE